MRVNPFVILPLDMDPQLRQALSDVIRAHAQQLNWATDHDVTSVATSTTVAHDLVIADSTASVVTCTLPKAKDWQDRVLRVKKVNSNANIVIVHAQSGETIDKVGSATISVQYSTLSLISDGAEWWKV